jgi:hypothetical protein
VFECSQPPEQCKGLNFVRVPAALLILKSFGLVVNRVLKTLVFLGQDTTGTNIRADSYSDKVRITSYVDDWFVVSREVPF